jgi:hypothetical protein
MRIIYQDDRVTIGESIAILDGVTYPISAIASVEARKIKPRGCLPLICYALAAPPFIAAAGLVQEIHSGNGAELETARIAFGLAVAVGVALVAVGFLLRGRSYHALVISTNAGERAALKAKDAAYIGRLHDAIQDAIVNSTYSSTLAGNRPQ